jgi:general secretion pathway protein G
MNPHEKENDRRHSARAGFSLVEIMLVVVIMGILASVVVVNIRGRSEEARISATRASIANLGTAIEMYEMQASQLPDSLAALTQPLGEQPPLLRSVPTDAWGLEFQYERKGRMDYKISSAGPDKQHGGDDDITN